MLLNIQMAPYNEAPALSILSLGELSWQRHPRPAGRHGGAIPGCQNALPTRTPLFLLWGMDKLLKVTCPWPCPREGQASEGPITGHTRYKAWATEQ